MYKFQSPYFLLMILPVIYLFFRKENKGAIKVASVKPIQKMVKKSRKDLIGRLSIYTSLILMCIALGRPQSVKQSRNIEREGIDIVISLDLSQSMLQDDFSPNRLEAAKRVIEGFVKKRPDDRIALVVFGGEAYTKVPLSYDHRMLGETIKKLGVEDITSNDRTAIGMGIGVALNRVKTSESKSKVVILLTDGENNSGVMSPMAAANIARELGIKVYTVGIGARELKVRSIFGTRKIKNTELDENLLEEIAKTTEGRYFRAVDEREFGEIFTEIDRLEKVKIEAKTYYERTEYFGVFLRAALILLLIGLICRYILFIRIP